MNESSLTDLLSDLLLGAVHYYSSIDSTNAQALRLAQGGAPHLTLVVADEQTAGRGRSKRRWFTLRGSALAFSLVLRPESLLSAADLVGQGGGSSVFTRLTAAGALAVVTALEKVFGLEAEIKWPNDVLVGGRKLAGVLVEADWLGQEMSTAVLGIGINVARGSEPPAVELLFPATSVESALGRSVDRWILLHAVTASLLDWLHRLESPEFLQAWEARLAYREQPVRVLREGGAALEGELLGLEEDGALRLRLPTGAVMRVPAGDVHLRPAGVDNQENRE